MADALYNGIGLLGMALMLVAYFLQQYGMAAPHTARYLWLNLSGSLSLLISLLHFWNLPVFLLEMAWALISVYGLVKMKGSRA